jgi:hypothetical protein
MLFQTCMQTHGEKMIATAFFSGEPSDQRMTLQRNVLCTAKNNRIRFPTGRFCSLLVSVNTYLTRTNVYAMDDRQALADAP